jgi:peptidyl-prolyl cis-trans isomerase A (cyclophilin A)
MSFRTLLASLLALAGLSGAAQAASSSMPKVEIVTSKGKILVELDPSKAPITVKNFLAYVDKKHYDDTIFHRVISGFMIQGGGFTADLTEKKTDAPIKLEAANGLSNLRGTLAMARTMVLDSATSQFFINHKDNPGLDTGYGGYAVFGKVLKGLDVVDAIAGVATGER